MPTSLALAFLLLAATAGVALAFNSASVNTSKMNGFAVIGTPGSASTATAKFNAYAVVVPKPSVRGLIFHSPW